MKARRRPVVSCTPGTETVSHELAKAEVLCTLDRDELMKLTPLCRATAVLKDEVIFAPGGKAAVYLVAYGRVVVVAQLEAGVEIELFTRRRHQLFGEVSLFSGKQTSKARAVERGMVIAVPARAFRDTVWRNSTAHASLEELIAQRMAQAEARIAEIAGHSVTLRVLRVLQRLALEAGARDSRGCLIMDRMTQEEVASLVGASRVSVGHALSALRAGGQIIMTGRRIIVCDVGQGQEGIL